MCLWQLPGLFKLCRSGKCYIGRFEPIWWRCLRMCGCKQSPSCNLTNFGGASTSSVTMLCGRLSPGWSWFRVQNESGKISKQVRGVWVASDSCNLFGLGLTTSIRLTSLRHKKLTSQRFSWIGNLSLMYLNVFYVQTVRALPCWGLHSASSSKLRLWKVVESCLPEVEVWQCRAPLCNLTNRVSTKGPELTSLNLWVVRHVLWYPLQQFHPRNYWGFRVDGRVAKGLKRYHVPR